MTERAGLLLAAQAALELDKREREERWVRDPFSWFLDRATLIDPLADGEKIAPFPDFPYLRELVNEIDTHNAIILWKSRRMIASWTAITYAVRLCTLFKHMRCFFIAKKEGESDGEGVRELVWRARFVAENLRGGPLPKLDAGKLHLHFTETGSTITGVSSDPNVMRQVSANFVLGDEMAFWERPKESYAALKPTLESRGKFVGISSSAEGFFEEIVKDQTDDSVERKINSIPGLGVVLSENTTIVSEDASVNIQSAKRSNSQVKIPGFAAWTNKFNKFRIVAMHYTADPRKRTAEWKAREQQGVPLSIWLQEYEMQFGLRAGRPVYFHEWRPGVMLVDGIKTERGKPILVSLDFGYHNPAMVVGQMRYGMQLCVLRSLQGKQLRFEDFMSQCLSSLKQWFPQRFPDNQDDFLWCCDVSGDQEHATGAPEVKILRRVFGIKPKFKKMKIPPTIDVVRGYMSRYYRGEPCFLVDNNPSNSLLVDGLNGGYAYPDGEVNEETRPDKDNTYDHLQDALRYMAVNFGGSNSPKTRAAMDRISQSDILSAQNYYIR